MNKFLVLVKMSVRSRGQGKSHNPDFLSLMLNMKGPENSGICIFGIRPLWWGQFAEMDNFFVLVNRQCKVTGATCEFGMQILQNPKSPGPRLLSLRSRLGGG